MLITKEISMFGSYPAQMSSRMASRVVQVVGAVCLLIVLALTLSPYKRIFQPAASIDLTKLFHFHSELKPNILDGCRHVYLDMGSNQGIQIRKLYEPQLFPGAPILPIFYKYFGPQASRLRAGTVCAVGWEPNPAHIPVLARLEEAYNRCGWKVKIHTQTGVGAHQVETHFKAMDWAGAGTGNGFMGHMEASAGNGTTTVDTIRIADFINNVVATRRIPKAEGEELPPAVVMKLDVEGKETEVTLDLVFSGALAHIDSLHADWVPVGGWEDPSAVRIKEAIELLRDFGNGYNLSHVAQVDGMDDESYGDYSGDLPAC